MTTPPRTCRCGHDLSHPLVTPEPSYNLIGWLLLGLGATPRPVRVEYRCSRCGVSLGTTASQDVLKKMG